MSGIVVLRAALEALNSLDSQGQETRVRQARPLGWGAAGETTPATAPAPAASGDSVERAHLIAAFEAGELVETRDDNRGDIYFDDELDSESVRLLALKAQQQLSIQALSIANVRALSIIGLFRDDEPPIRLM